jgi:outer membrane cobalamin receptor
MKSGLAGPRSAFSFLAVTLVAACATAPVGDATAPKEREGQIITREDIERSGARDGWEALRWGATHLNFQYTREGSPVRVTHRGVDSFVIDPQVLLIVDGAQMQSLSTLENIPATSIEYIQILAARVGVVKYGTNGGNGVIVVKTGVPLPKKR